MAITGTMYNKVHERLLIGDEWFLAARQGYFRQLIL